MAQTDDVVIDVTNTKGGVRGRIAALAQEYLMKARALQITSEILAEDDQRLAVERAPKKFLQAMTHRANSNGAAPVLADAPSPLRGGVARVAAYLAAHPDGATTAEIMEATGLSKTRVTTVAHQVAEMHGGQGSSVPRWVLTSSPTRMTATTTKQQRKTPVPKQPVAVRLQQIVAYLTDHPEASTQDVSAAINLAHTRLLTIIRRVAKALPKKTRSTGEALRWVLLKKMATTPTSKATGVTRRGSPRKQSTGSWYAKPAITGKAMTLFLLEHLSRTTVTTPQQIADQLAEAGSPIKSLRYLNAPLGGTLLQFKYATRKGDGYVLTARGETFRGELRARLEGTGQVVAGGYLAP